jgi:hypothetical protein
LIAANFLAHPRREDGNIRMDRKNANVTVHG